MKTSLRKAAKALGYLGEQESPDRDTSKDTTSGEFNVNVPVQNEMEKVNIKYGHATGPLEDVTISWGDESHNVDFEKEDVIDDHGNEGKDMTFVAFSQDDKWRFIVDVSVEANYELSGNIQEVNWDTLEIDVDDAKVNEQEDSETSKDVEALANHPLLDKINTKQEWVDIMKALMMHSSSIPSVSDSIKKSTLLDLIKNMANFTRKYITEEEDPRRPKDIEFDNAQAMSKLTPDDRDKVGRIQQMMSKEREANFTDNLEKEIKEKFNAYSSIREEKPGMYRVKFSFVRREFEDKVWEEMLEFITNKGFEIDEKMTSNYYEPNYDREEPAEAVPMIYFSTEEQDDFEKGFIAEMLKRRAGIIK